MQQQFGEIAIDVRICCRCAANSAAGSSTVICENLVACRRRKLQLAIFTDSGCRARTRSFELGLSMTL